MKRVLNSRKISLFVALPFLLLMLSTTASAQNNIIVNGDFEAGNTGFFTHYIYEPTYGMLAGRYCIDNTVDGHGENNSFLPPDGSSGKYMIVNGFGGDNNQNKVVWRQTVNVTSNTWYTFSFKYANLSQRFLWYGEGAILRFLIDGPLQDVNDIQLNAGDQYWHTYPNYRWYSGNVAGEIHIEFRDVFDGSPGDGDDFALDNISFVPDVVYSVNAQDDDSIVCLNSAVSIPVVNNDNVLPNGNDNNVSVQILTPLNQIHGTTTMPTINNNVITYNYNDATYTGNTADFQYRVTWHGLTSDAWVHISLNRAPEVGAIQAPDEPICDGFPLGINVPSVAPNTQGYWEISPTGSAPWSQLQNPNSIGLEYNNYYVRYTASNDCGPNSSNAVQIHVVSAPTAPTISSPDPICEGPNAAFDLPTIPPGNNGYSGGWLIADNPNGPFVSFTNANITYDNHNGRYICYFVQNDCGGPFNSNAVQLTVNAAPIVPNIQTPAGICEGGSFNLTTPQPINWRDNNAPSNTHSYGWEIQDPITGEWGYLVNNNIPFEYNGCHIRYMAHNVCDYGYSNEVALTVYSTQPIVLPDVTFCQEGYYHGVWCSQDGHEYGYDSLTPNNCTIHVSWLFHLSEDYNTHPQTQTECDEFYWPQTGITYHNSGIYNDTVPNPNPVECDDIYTLDLTINHAPVITEQLESPNPIEVCSSIGILNVTAPAFENGGTSYWEYATSENGPWNDGFNPASFNLEYGSYWLRYVVDNDCSDVPVPSNPVPFYVSEAPAVSIAGGQQLHDFEICDGEVMDWPQVLVEWRCQPNVSNTRRWEKASEQDGTYVPFDTTAAISNDCWIRYFVQNSCDSVVLGPVHVSVISVNDEEMTHEDCDLVVFEGLQYTSDTVIDVLLNEPCPHTIHHNIVVHHSEYIMEPIPQTTCHDEFVWHGQIYYRSDGPEQLMHFDTFTEYGCDKVMEQLLVFDDFSTKTESRKGCGIFYWPRNDSTYYYDENQMHIQDSWFIPGDGEVCDSIIYLSLDLDREYEYEGDPMTECRGFEWHGVTYYEDAIVYDSLTTKIAHCDSIISYRLTIIQPFDTIVEMESCKPKWWHCQDQENLFDEDGEEYTATLTAQMTGCDSIVTIRFSLLPEITLPVEDVLVCEPFVLPDGQIVDHSDFWSYTIHSLDECDTIVRIQVEFVQTDTLTDEPQYACDSLTFHGFTYGPGIHEIWYDTVFAPNGCIRSVQLLNLTVKDSEQVGTINGASNVYVASSLISGIYRYEIDTEGLAGPATWSLSNPDWQIIEQGDDFCRVFVSTPGNATLTAHFNVEECGEMERSFEINAVFYGVDDYQGVDVHIFPNPTKGSVTIETEGIESLRLIDMMGQVLETREYDRSDSVTLNLSTYTPSVYLFEIKTVYGVVKKRLILCR